MEAGGRLDCYEDMFKEITRKLYGEDPDHRTSNVQNEFEASVSYKTEEDAGNATDASDESKWTLDDEPLKGTEGSRIAAYCAATSTWRCYDRSDCMGSGPREVAEHFIDLHASRIIGEEAVSRARALHSSSSAGKDYLGQTELKVGDMIAYLERVREKAERSAPPTRRTQETQTVPATLLPVTPSFLLQELPNALPPHLHQSAGSIQVPSSGTTPTTGACTAASNSSPGTSAGGASAASSGGGGGGGRGGGRSGGGSGNNASGKRYTCLYCPYGTDRRDLYTRHENIHREEKPFHCYVCCKPFSRADHVKKHFLRMHREHTYELSRIRRPLGSGCSSIKASVQHNESSVNPSNTTSTNNTTTNNNNSNTNNNNNSSTGSSNNNNNNNGTSPYASSLYLKQSPPHLGISTSTYQLQPAMTNNMHVASAALYQASLVVTASNLIQHQQQQQQQQQHQPEASVTTLGHNNTAQSSRRVQHQGTSSKSHLKSQASGSSKANQERRYTCCYCSWSGVDNWCLKRHLNTHLKPFACTLCEYKAARAERLATHVLKVHNRRQCSRCSFLGDDLAQLQMHQLHVHRVSGPSSAATAAVSQPQPSAQQQTSQQSQNQQQLQQQQPQQPMPIHPVAGGRPPPGPPVFPASSAAIAPATTVIPPTTILGERPTEIASVPGSSCWIQEASSCEMLFQRSIESRRSRKQSTPRRIVADKLPETGLPGREPADLPSEPSRKSSRRCRRAVRASNSPLQRCLLCPRGALARAFRDRPYHTRRSLMLHKLWRHGLGCHRPGSSAPRQRRHTRPHQR